MLMTKDNDGWYPAETLMKLKKIMRGKLLALRQGRILSDDEFISILYDKSIATNPASDERGASAPPEDEQEEEDAEEEDEVEGENVEEDRGLNARVDDLINNLIQQSEEHLSIPHTTCANISYWFISVSAI
jgi:hypothetical protein